MEQRPDTRICVVQRISDGMKECEGDGSQRKSEAVKRECRTAGGQTVLLSLSPFPPPFTHTSITVSGREGYRDGKRCVFRADFKADVELE